MHNNCGDSTTATAASTTIFSINPVPMATVQSPAGLLKVDSQNSQEQASSTPTSPKRRLAVFAAVDAQPAAHSDESSNDFNFRRQQTDNLVEDETNSTACKRKLSSDVDYELNHNTGGFSQVDSTQSGVIAEPTAFDQVVMPFVNTLPSQISQHSIFTLPKPAFVARARKDSSGLSSSQDGL